MGVIPVRAKTADLAQIMWITTLAIVYLDTLVIIVKQVGPYIEIYIKTE